LFPPITSEIPGDEHEVRVDHDERRAHVPPEDEGVLRVVHAEVEIRELGHPHHPIRSAGYLHHLSLVTGHRGRSGRSGDEGQEDGKEPGAARPHGEGADREHDGGILLSPSPQLYASNTKATTTTNVTATVMARARSYRGLQWWRRRRRAELVQTAVAVDREGRTPRCER